MQDIIRKLDFKKEDFYNDYIGNYHSKFQDLARENENLTVPERLKLIELLLVKVDESLVYRGFGSKEFSDSHYVYMAILQEILYGIDEFITRSWKQNMKLIINFIKFISTYKGYTSEFLTELFVNMYKIVRDSEFYTKIDLELFALMIDALKFKLNFEPRYMNLDNFNDLPENLKDIVNKQRNIGQRFHYPVEDFLKSLNTQTYSKLITHLQNFYE